MSIIRVSHPSSVLQGSIQLDGSKSISNRILIIRALCQEHFDIHQLSTSDDTSTLRRLLDEGGDDEVYNVGHAGTTFRFLTAYLAIQKGTQTLTGSTRMLQRPIGPLVDALRQLGCQIDYLGEEGYPPLQIKEVDVNSLSSEVTIDAGVSSQYLTALLLIAPSLPEGITLHLKGDMVSESYLKLTLGILQDFGIKTTYQDQKITVRPQAYVARPYTVEADWSAASYYFSLVALAKEAEVRLGGLQEESFQGDADIVRYSEKLGVKTSWDDEGLLLKKIPAEGALHENYINMPDIAQTVATICAAAGIDNEFSGLKALRIKETDRISAMHTELGKIGSAFTLARSTDDDEYYSVQPGVHFDGVPTFDTYKDHRMAMCLAPLALLHPVEVRQPDVVSKSYPDFWVDLERLGFVIESKD